METGASSLVTETFRSWRNSSRDFLFEGGRRISYAELHRAIEKEREQLSGRIGKECALAIEAESSFSAFLKQLACLIEGVPVLLCPPYQFQDSGYRSFLATEVPLGFVYCPRDATLGDAVKTEAVPTRAGWPDAAMAERFAAARAPFIVRTSGSSGKKFKFILHDAELFLARNRGIPPGFEKTLAFFPAESIGGIETLLETISHQAAIVAHGDRLEPGSVALLIQEQEIDWIHTTPTFLNFMALSKHLDRGRLPSLREIAFGSEPATEATLSAVRRLMPGVPLRQTYGMSEIGVLRTTVCGDDPTLFRLDERYNLARLNDGMLEVRSMTNMLGYLNLPTPERPDGWFRTGDKAERAASFIRVLGRGDDVISVAARKFYPSELEALIAAMPGVADATVCKAVSDFLGNVVIAKISLVDPEDREAFLARFKQFCEAEIPFFMRPHKVEIVSGKNLNPRFKKVRIY